MDQVLSWEEYFMSIALVSALRSKDPRTRVGSCIVNDHNRIVGIGYNGMPSGCDDDEFPWAADGPPLEQKYFYVVHAELNAILNATTSLLNCRLYSTLFPCNECCKSIIQSGIKQVVYLSDKYESRVEVIAAKRMLDAAGVAYRKFNGGISSLTVEFA
jgi:dCMP deaminase